MKSSTKSLRNIYTKSIHFFCFRPDVRLVEKLQTELNQSEISIKISREKHSDWVEKLKEAEQNVIATERDPMIDFYNLIQVSYLISGNINVKLIIHICISKYSKVL